MIDSCLKRDKIPFFCARTFHIFLKISLLNDRALRFANCQQLIVAVSKVINNRKLDAPLRHCSFELELVASCQRTTWRKGGRGRREKAGRREWDRQICLQLLKYELTKRLRVIQFASWNGRITKLEKQIKTRKVQRQRWKRRVRGEIFLPTALQLWLDAPKISCRKCAKRRALPNLYKVQFSLRHCPKHWKRDEWWCRRSADLPSSSDQQISYRPRNMVLGSSTALLMVLRNVTASRPSTRRWSYVSAMNIMGRITTWIIPIWYIMPSYVLGLILWRTITATRTRSKQEEVSCQTAQLSCRAVLVLVSSFDRVLVPLRTL